MKSNFSASPNHEKFEELAALAAVGELSALELEHLRRHLADCSQCTEAYKAFAEVAANDLGVSAAGRETFDVEHASLGSPVDAEARECLGRLRNRLRGGSAEPACQPGSLAMRRQTGSSAGAKALGSAAHRRAIYGVAATILLAATVAGGMALWRSAKALSTERAHARELQSTVDSLKQQARNERTGADNAVLRSLEESQKARDVLQKSLAASERRNEELLAREKAAEEKLATAIQTSEELRQKLDRNEGDRDRLAKLQKESDLKLHDALRELNQIRQAGAETAAKNQAREDGSVEASGQASPETGAMPATPSEMEARNLFGARDLHIVDVYDVAGDGKTKRTYGRVYYVEKKLLVFYAFDLEDRRQHKRGVFQAWGYREANVGKALNLGFFVSDDTAVSRWVLTVNRPDVLSHIDAVFVTVEPPGGSKEPRGKKVLYANLIGPPNHP